MAVGREPVDIGAIPDGCLRSRLEVGYDASGGARRVRGPANGR